MRPVKSSAAREDAAGSARPPAIRERREIITRYSYHDARITTLLVFQ